MLLRHLNSCNVAKSYESPSKQASNLALYIPGNSKPIADGSLRKEAYLCELRANHFLPLSTFLFLPASLSTWSGESHVVSSPAERPMWQGTEVSCQQ